MTYSQTHGLNVSLSKCMCKGVVLMPYQVCDSCDILYPISEDEEVFEFCRCDGNLRYYGSLLEYFEDVEGSELVRKVIRLQRTYTEQSL